MCHIGKGNYEKDFCVIILNSDQWFRCLLKIFLIYSSGSSKFGGAEPFVQFWYDIMINISVKSF